MKKTIAFVVSLAAAFSMFTACEKQNSDSSTDNTLKTDTTNQTLQPDPLDVTTTSEVTLKGLEEEETTAEATEENKLKPSKFDDNSDHQGGQVDPLGGGTVKPNKDGGINIENVETQDDRVLMTAAQSLFNSACRTEWEFKFGCPYEIDESTYIENDYGWQYKLITDPSIHSMQDVINDYCKVFSSAYPVDLSTEYIEKDGAVYALAPKRGADIFYSISRITGVLSRNGNEVVLQVTNFYTGNDSDNKEAYSENDEFSMVLGDDGVWRAGKFKLPY